MAIPTKALKGIIENEKGEILLLQRNPKVREANNWDLLGGLVEYGESEKECLFREIKEELGVEVEILKPLRTWKFYRALDNNWVEVQNYLCKISSGKIKLSEEHIGYRWVKSGDIKKYPVKDDSFYDSLT